MQFRQLGATGLHVSALGLGTSPFGGVFGEVSEADCKTCLDTALGLGINFIDCSPYYGLTKAETMLGKTLQGVPRESYILSTKVGRYGSEIADFDFSAARVTRSLDESLQRLGLDYVDIIQCHDIEFGDLKQIVTETVPTLRELVQIGKARYVGITGLPLRSLKAIAEATPVDVVLSYCHYSLNDTSLETLLPWLHENRIGIISASPLSMGLLTRNGPPPWHQAPQELKAACRAAAEYCENKGIDIAQVAVAFSSANEAIATTVVGTSRAAEIEANVRWASEPIDVQLLADVLEILRPVTGISWPTGRPENR